MHRQVCLSLTGSYKERTGEGKQVSAKKMTSSEKHADDLPAGMFPSQVV